MKSFRSTLDTSFSEEFSLHSSCYVLVRSFSYTPRAGFNEDSRSSPDTSFSEEFFLHYSGYVFSEEFFLHSSSWL